MNKNMRYISGTLSVTLLLFTFLVFDPKEGSAQSSLTYYVSTTGNDNNPGTLDAPFRTLEAARNHGNAAAGSSATIYLRGGEYFLSTTFPLSNTNWNASKKLLISNYNNESVTISGGQRLDNSKISLVTDKAILSRLPAEAAYKLYVTSLKAQGVADPGQLTQTGYGHTMGPAPVELFIGDQAFQLARSPNSGKIAIGQVISPGTLVGSPVRSGAKFQFSYAPAAKWTADDIKNLWISGILNMGWSDETVPVASLSGGNTVTLGDLTVYGVESNMPSATNTVKDRLVIRGFNFFNVLDALDTVGEYYIDRANDLLYFWPSGSVASSEIVVSTLTLSLISITNLSNVTINGIKFAYTRGSAIEGSGASHITISNSTFCNLGENAVTTNNCTYFLVNQSKFFNIGSTAIGLLGGDRTTLKTSGNVVQNSEFYNDGRIWHSFNPPITLNGVGSTVSNCYFHDLAGQAILYQGNNHLIVNNQFNNVCTGFSDIGAVATGRDPSSTGTTIQNNFFENITTIAPEILVTAIYIDDGSGGIKVHSNLFVNCGTGGSQLPAHGLGAVHINGGADNDFQNNIFINSQMAISGIQWNQQTWKTYLADPTIKSLTTQVVNILSPVYLQQYPFLKNFFDPTRQRSNLIHNSISINVGTFNNTLLNVVSNLFANANPSLQSANSLPSIINYFKTTGIPTEPRAWLGFTPINFNAIGMQSN